MPADRVLLFTDVEGSTQLTEQLGDIAASSLWTEHDRIARELMRKWQGHEIDKSDGFLILFDRVESAARFALDLHHAFANLTPPLRARAGIHSGPMIARQNTSEDVTLGAKPLELDGVGKAIASRIMSIARGGQTLLSAPARAALSGGDWKLHSHGHWRMKGLAEPIEVFELGDGRTLFVPPIYSEKAFRVVQSRGGWTALADLPHSLPAERDIFVARDEVLDSLAALFRDERRLVTVLGIGGIGKTRLAIRYASTWLGDYPGGAWFCDLSAASSIDGIALGVAQGLDVPLGKADPVQQLGAAIASRGPCLIILDNFEQVARYAEATIGQWLEKAHDASFLVTSREVLGIVGEEAFELAPLPIDAAVRLFEIRARAAHPPFKSAGAEQGAIANLVELLDRLPLAIELAAARVRVMSPRVMLERMGDRFKLLASFGGRRERQATLRATLDWSWELLSHSERSVLTQLAVFEGGFSLRAAEAVVQVPRSDATREAEWLPDVVQGLVEKSLLRQAEGLRFEMLRSVHDYATSQLHESAVPTSLHATQAYRRHWTYFGSLDETAATAERCADRENLIVACRRAAAASDTARAIGALSNAAAALQLTGPFRAILELAGVVETCDLLNVRELAVLNRVAGTGHLVLGQADNARARFAIGLQQARSTVDVATIVRILCLKANLATTGATADSVLADLEEAKLLATSSGDPSLEVRVLSSSGAFQHRSGHIAQAIQSYEAAVKIAAVLGNKHWQGGMSGNLGFIALTQGRLADARNYLEMALACASEMGDRQWEGNTRCNLGLLLYHLGEPDAAKSELERTLALAKSVGHRRLEATVLCNLGIVAEARNDLEHADDRYREAVSLAAELTDDLLEAQFRGYLGLLLAKGGHLAESTVEFTRAAEKAEPRSDPAVLALLYCQRAIASGVSGDEPARQDWLSRADGLVTSDDLKADAELAQAFATARRSPSLN
ncbi:MAG TPA: tetratricopeptide repeat protein [Steroidobacteraceae bacterium]|nr:tetratricopeptide repeat protein [Steroidobacteraceae bacterium]